MLVQTHVSMKYCSGIILAIILFSCESSKPDKESTFSEGELNFLDSLRIYEGNLPLGFPYNENLHLKRFTFK